MSVASLIIPVSMALWISIGAGHAEAIAPTSTLADTTRVEVGSPLVNGTFYVSHTGLVTMVRMSSGSTDTIGRWTNELIMGDSAGRPIHRWYTTGWTRGSDGTTTRFDLWQTFDARTLALHTYRLRSGKGTDVRLTIEATRVRGSYRAHADSQPRNVDIMLRHAGFVAGAADLVPPAMGLREGLVIVMPVWNPPADSVETQIWTIDRRRQKEFEGRSLEAWEGAQHDADGKRIGSIWFVNAPPYMVRWDFVASDGGVVRLIGESGDGR